MNPPDLKRSLLQYKQHLKLGFLKLNSLKKLFLTISFFLLLPTTILNIFFIKRIKKNKIFVLNISNDEPYNSIYTSLRKNKLFVFIKKDRLQYPIVPLILVKDIFCLIRTQPLIFLSNFIFFAALTIKISQYYGLVKRHSIKDLLLFQEYSFYSSYLTYILENENRNLYNAMHGVPNNICCYFRFSKCFIWGKHYRSEYLLNHAEPTQFLVTGSIFHYSISKIKDTKEEIDLLYVIQGYVGGETDTTEIFNLLVKLSLKYNVVILPHPRNKISIPDSLVKFQGNIIDAIKISKIVLSGYSTALLDSTYMGKKAIAYIGKDSHCKIFVPYLSPENIIINKESLEPRIIKLLDSSSIVPLSKSFIDNSKNPVDLIAKEIMSHNK